MEQQKEHKKGVMDVSRPGKTAANPSSRPVLLNHKPVLQDPMFNSTQAEKVEVKTKQPEPGMSAGGAQTPQPQPEPKPEPGPAAQPSPGPTPSVPTPSPPQALPEQPPTQPATDSVPPDASPPPTTSEQNLSGQTAEPAKPEANVKQLVHDKTYFMPITQPPKRRGWLWIVAVVIVFAAFAAAYFLMTNAS